MDGGQAAAEAAAAAGAVAIAAVTAISQATSPRPNTDAAKKQATSTVQESPNSTDRRRQKSLRTGDVGALTDQFSTIESPSRTSTNQAKSQPEPAPEPRGRKIPMQGLGGAHIGDGPRSYELLQNHSQ